MRHAVLSLAGFVLMASVAFGDAKIPVSDRVSNQYPGYCAWAAIETICRHQGVKAGYDLVEKRKRDTDFITEDGFVLSKNLGADAPIAAKMKQLGIKYRMNPTFGDYQAGVDQIERAVKEGHGAVIMVYHGLPLANECHAVTVIDINNDTYCYIDSNDPKAVYEGTMAFFKQEFTGFVLTVER